MAPTLVVVGDDASFRYLIQRYAKKSACQVQFLYLTDDVVAAVLREAPCAVMVELDAPDERGRAALHALRLHPDTQQIPVIACSWMDELEVALEAGAALSCRNRFSTMTFGRCCWTWDTGRTCPRMRRRPKDRSINRLPVARATSRGQAAKGA